MISLNNTVRALYGALPPKRGRDAKVARALGINRGNFSNWRRGRVEFSAERLNTLHQIVWGHSLTYIVHSAHHTNSPTVKI